MNDGIKSHDAGQGIIRQLQSQHISLRESNLRIELLSLFQHSLGKVQSKDGDARLVQIAGYVTGTATDITYPANPRCFSSKTIQKRAVERLTLKFIEDMARVLIRNPVIAVPN